MRYVPLPCDVSTQSICNLRIVIKTEDSVGLGEFCSEVTSITLAEAANRDYRAGSTCSLLEISGRKHRVDRVFFRYLHETAGVHEHRRGMAWVIDELPTRRR
jgi:hypothetical protein